MPAHVFAFYAIFGESPDTTDEIVVLREGFDDTQAEGTSVEPSDLHFVMLFLWKADSQFDAEERIRQYCSEELHLLRLDLLTEDVRFLTRRYRRLAARMNDGDGYIHSGQVGFKKDSKEAEDQAKLIVRMAALRGPWQFWR